MTDRAVSEVAGYTVLFGVILLAFSSLALVGTTSLTDARDRTQATNVESAFEILAENVDDHANDRATGRATEVRVSDASLSFGASEEFNVTVSPVGSSEVQSYVVDTDPIVYESNRGSTVVYSNGALFREDGTESRMIRTSAYRISENATMLPHTDISGTDQRITIGGSEPVLVRTEQDRTPRLYQNATEASYDVTLRITTREPRADAWAEYLESHDLSCTIVDRSAQEATLECAPFTTDEVYVPVTRLTAEFS